MKKEEFLTYLLSLGYKPQTIVNAEIYLWQFLKWLKYTEGKEVKEVTATVLTGYQHYLFYKYKKKDGKPLSYRGALAKLSMVKKYFDYLAKHKHIFFNPIETVQWPRVKRHIPKNILTQPEAELLLELPDKNTTEGIRNRAILELLYSSGMRRGELCKLDMHDVDLKEQIVHIRYPKNRQDRIVPIGSKASKSIESYLLRSRHKISKYPLEKALFLNQYGKRLVGASLNNVIQKYSKRMNLNKHITLHCLRHSCAVHMLQNGASIVMIQAQLGHSRLDSTEVYTRIMPKDLKETIQKYHPRGKIKRLQEKKQGL